MEMYFYWKVQVVSDRATLHSIDCNEFLDSPEFESSRATGETKFRVDRFPMLLNSRSSLILCFLLL